MLAEILKETCTDVCNLPQNASRNKMDWGFPVGAVVKNPPANAEDTRSSPGPGRSHMPRSNKARAPQLLSQRTTTTEARVPRA